MLTFQQAKVAIEKFTHLQTDALHIYVGLLIFLGCHLWLSRGLRDGRPVILVVLVAVAGETLDISSQVKYSLPIAYGESAKDILNTTATPVIAWTFARLTQGWATCSQH